MAANKEPIFIGGIKGVQRQFVSVASAFTAAQDIWDGDAAESTRIDSIILTTTDGSAATAQLSLSLHDGTITNTLAIMSVGTASAGMTTTAAPVNVLANAFLSGLVKVDASGNKYLNIPPGYKLRAGVYSTSAGQGYHITTLGGKY